MDTNQHCPHVGAWEEGVSIVTWLSSSHSWSSVSPGCSTGTPMVLELQTELLTLATVVRPMLCEADDLDALARFKRLVSHMAASFPIITEVAELDPKWFATATQHLLRVVESSEDADTSTRVRVLTSALATLVTWCDAHLQTTVVSFEHESLEPPSNWRVRLAEGAGTGEGESLSGPSFFNREDTSWHIPISYKPWRYTLSF